MSFYIPTNNVGPSTVTASRSSGSPTISVALSVPAGMGIPFRLSAWRGSGSPVTYAPLAIFGCTGWTGNTITVSGAIDGTTDCNLQSGDVLLWEPSAGDILDLQAAAATGSRAFGAIGTPTVSSTTPMVFFDRAFVCAGLTAACDTAPEGGPCTVVIQHSTDASTWTTLGTISITSGNFSATAALTTAIAANTYLRGEFTAVNGVVDVTVILFLKG